VRGDRWKQIEDCYHAALERPAEQRPEFLAQACANDPELRREVLSLLAHEGHADELLEIPAWNHIALVDKTGTFAPGASSAVSIAADYRFSHFRIVRKLGEGGMGKVYLAEDLTLHRQVALKFLAFDPDDSPKGFLDRFRREARAAAALKHPNICTIYGVEECDGQPVIEMEYVEGETLAARIAKGALPLEEALTLTSQVAGALAEAHRKGIVHRDLKPANIMLTQFGVKVLDFGLAKIILAGEAGDHTSTLTGTREGTVLGTPCYMSPEQARAEDADGRADLFSLGVLLYEMTTGERPFTGKSSPAVLAAVLKETPAWPSQRRPQLPAGLDTIVGKALEKERGLRYQSAEEMRAACGQLLRELEAPRSPRLEPARSRPWRRIMAGAATTLALAAGLATWLTMTRKAHALTATDTVVLADFANRTGDADFDGDTLQEALSAYLTQSPFLSILPEPTVNATLKLMGRPKGAKLDNETTRELCLRSGSRAYFGGSIGRIGNQYRIALQVVVCENGEIMARTEATAAGKEKVISALDEAARKLREKVGESLASLKQFSTPLLQVTTPSLDALRAYSEARNLMRQADNVGAKALFQYAIRQDPNFAMAILSLGLCEGNLGETVQAAEDYRKAYELRGNLSEWEKFAIESRYYFSAVGDLERARQTYATWAKTYPRESIAISNVGSVEATLGNRESELEHRREAVRLGPSSAHYGGLIGAYLALDRLDDAKSTIDEEVSKIGRNNSVPSYLYALDFLRNDPAGMAQQVAWSVGKPGIEDQFLGLEAVTAAYSGRIGAARRFVRRAVVLAQQVHEDEAAAAYIAGDALPEALFGFRTEARQQAAAALKLSNGRGPEYLSALALAIAGDAKGAQALADDLERRFPSDTIVQFVCLPAIRSRLAAGHREYAKAVDILQASAPYELGDGVGLIPSLYAAYLRGEAYLGGGRNLEAAAEFQKVLNHRGLVGNYPIGPLARLDLARAYSGEHDIAKAKENYQAFFDLWKDADSDVPVLREAQVEYRKLK
jgi:serine/threonine protein kinase/tetratricopeptide (TPR) repeat protein